MHPVDGTSHVLENRLVGEKEIASFDAALNAVGGKKKKVEEKVEKGEHRGGGWRTEDSDKGANRPSVFLFGNYYVL